MGTLVIGINKNHVFHTKSSLSINKYSSRQLYPSFGQLWPNDARPVHSCRLSCLSSHLDYSPTAILPYPQKTKSMQKFDKFSHLTGTESKIRAALSGNALFDQE
ncbi:hypothetical protein T02_2244 [Trichinella nativa]|uniref:Uncharacterized protein n=1 Tax=Trichinella nativa TaxID=6335 RepID=A0A0V1LHX3_9BILA|nr:hypothetical protein T02_2244 [Trichinella nativa]